LGKDVAGRGKLCQETYNVLYIKAAFILMIAEKLNLCFTQMLGKYGNVEEETADIVYLNT